MGGEFTGAQSKWYHWFEPWPVLSFSQVSTTSRSCRGYQPKWDPKTVLTHSHFPLKHHPLPRETHLSWAKTVLTTATSPSGPLVSCSARLMAMPQKISQMPRGEKRAVAPRGAWLGPAPGRALGVFPYRCIYIYICTYIYILY